MLTKHPLQSLLRRSDFRGQIAKCATRLGLFDVRYKPWNAIKGQVLADLVAEFTPIMSNVAWFSSVLLMSWQVYVDGASNAQGARVGIVLVSPEGTRLKHSLRLSFRASNNEAKYEAFIVRLRTDKELATQVVEIFSDSRLVVSQVERRFEARDPRMAEY